MQPLLSLLLRLLPPPLLLCCWAVTGIGCAELVGPGGYTRVLELQNGTTLACTGVVEESGMKALVVYRQSSEETVLESKVMSWERVATVATASSQATDLANCMLIELPVDGNSVIVAAYRYHSQPFQNGTWGRYTIKTQRSVDGMDWSQPPQVAFESALLGAWEPFLWAGLNQSHNTTKSTRNQPGRIQHHGGSPNSTTVHCTFSLELSPHWEGIGKIEQDIVDVVSFDGALSWQRDRAPRTLVHTDGSRNGMPGIARVGSTNHLVMVFEGFWDPQHSGHAGEWGQFTVQAVESLDDGDTWNTGSVIHASPNRRKSGAPQVAFDGASAQLVAAFMTDEDVAFPRPNYVDNCTIKWITSAPVLHSTAFVNWTNSTARACSPFQSAWPGLWQASRGALSVSDRKSNSDLTVQVIFGFNGSAYATPLPASAF